MRDIRELFDAAQPRQLAPPDLQRIEQRVIRRRAGRATAAGLGVAAAVGLFAVLAGGPVPSSPVVDQPPAPSATASSSPSAAQTSGAYADAPVLSIEQFPALGDEGVAIGTTHGVVFIGLDGTVHGQLPGATLSAPSSQVIDGVPGLVRVGPGDVGGAYWIDAVNGASLDEQLGIPVLGGLLVHQGDAPGRYVLAADPDGSLDVSINPMTDWRLSANHDVINWTECGDATELSECEHVRVADLDVGGSGTLPTGCWYSDKLGDFYVVATCWQPWSQPGGDRGDSWLEVPSDAGPGDPIRVDVPLYEGADRRIGHWVKALVGGPDVVAQLSLECEVPHVVGVDDGRVVGLFGDRWHDGPSAILLGTAGSVGDDAWASAPVVWIPDAACGDTSGTAPGIYVVKPGGTLVPVVTDDSILAAQMWTHAPNLTAAPFGDPSNLYSGTSCNEHALLDHADVDGDGATDQIAWHTAGGLLMVCTAAGQQQTLEWSGMGEAFHVADVQPDGQVEIFFGGTTVSARGHHVATWHEGALTAVTITGGDRLDLWDGITGFDPERDVTVEHDTWSCEDVDGDGIREIVTAHSVLNDDGNSYTTTIVAYRIEDARAIEVQRRTRQAPRGTDGPARITTTDCLN